MQYALLIYTAEPPAEVPEDLMREEMEAYHTFTQHVAQRGALKAGETATRLIAAGRPRRRRPAVPEPLSR